MNLVKTSYSVDDVEILLKDLSDVMKPMSTEERERAIQSGVHYSEMLPIEKEPTEEYMRLFNQSLKRNKHAMALYTAAIAEKLYNEHGKNLVLISLARAGLPIGILIKRWIRDRHNVVVPHYGISIIRGRGIDVNAMDEIYRREQKCGVENFRFVDGWTGKGAIQNQLNEAVEQLWALDEKWTGLNARLAVVADPANITEDCGTHRDFLIPSSCLNSTVSGLVSRTILNSNIDVEAGDYHGAVYLKPFEGMDKSNDFINEICEEMKQIKVSDAVLHYKNLNHGGLNGFEVAENIRNHEGLKDTTFVKPGIGETTRVLLRRVPNRVYLSKDEQRREDVLHILQLCKEKNVPVEVVKPEWLGNYAVVGAIKDLSADA